MSVTTPAPAHPRPACARTPRARWGPRARAARVKAPAEGSCAGRACWAGSATGFKYKDRELTPDGLSAVSLKSGPAGKAKISVGGKGPNLHLPPALSLATPVRVQLKRSGSDTCWEGTFSNPSRNQADKFVGHSD